MTQAKRSSYFVKVNYVMHVKWAILYIQYNTVPIGTLFVSDTYFSLFRLQVSNKSWNNTTLSICRAADGTVKWERLRPMTE